MYIHIQRTKILYIDYFFKDLPEKIIPNTVIVN